MMYCITTEYENRLNHGGIQSTDSTMLISITGHCDIFQNKFNLKRIYIDDCITNNLYQCT